MGCIQAYMTSWTHLDLILLATQLHLRDYTLPRPLLHQSRAPPPTIRSEYVALQPHLAAPPLTHDRLYTILPRPSGCPTLSDHTSTISTSPSDHPPPSHHLYDTPTSPSDHPPPSHCLYDTPTSPSDHPPPSHRLYDAPISPSACPSPTDRLPATTTHPPVRQSSPTIHRTHDSLHSLAVVNGEQSFTIHRTQDSSQSLAVVNGEQSRKARKFHRAFANYDLLLRAVDYSSIYLRDLRCVAPPTSGENAHITHGKCDFGGATLNHPSFGFSYVLSRLWDPGGVRSSPNAPRDRSRAFTPSRYPYGPCTGYLVNLPNLR